MPKFRNISGHEVIKIICNKFGFEVSGKSGSHVRLSKQTPNGKVGTVVPEHKQLKIGTLKGVLKLAKISLEEFEKYV
ncbi:MAG: type II toxin-antitoxin system HicA family toxin [Nanoarchaeota archaeon]